MDGEKLRKVLADKGMSQYRLAKITGIPAYYINRIIQSNTNVKERTLFTICDALGCKAEEIREDN